jgi:hypothetical protein
MLLMKVAVNNQGLGQNGVIGEKREKIQKNNFSHA